MGGGQQAAGMGRISLPPMAHAGGGVSVGCWQAALPLEATKREAPAPGRLGSCCFPALPCPALSVRGEKSSLSHSLDGAFASVLGNGAVRVGVDSPAV